MAQAPLDGGEQGFDLQSVVTSHRVVSLLRKPLAKRLSSAFMQRPFVFFGGSFNPIHVGHVAVVEQLLALGVDKVFVVPTNRSPFKKQPLLPNALRLEMVRLAFQRWKDVVVLDFEIQHSGVTYTHHTLKHLQIQYPGVSWNLVLGWDAYCDFPQWKNAKQIAQAHALWVVPRLGSLNPKVPGAESVLLPVFHQWFAGIVWDVHQKAAFHEGREVLRYLDFQTPAISSTEIRSGRCALQAIPSQAQVLYANYLKEPPRKKTNS